MDVRATHDSESKSVATMKAPRGAWVLTAYGITGLAVFGVLAYYFSSYVAN